MTNLCSVGVLGAGTQGTALAKLLTLKGYDVWVWSALSEEIDRLNATNQHPKLPGVELPAGLNYTASLQEACTNKEVVVVATPSIFVRQTAKQAREFLPENQIVVCVAKGIETATSDTMTDIIEEELSGLSPRVVALSGPTHAEEVVRCMPSTIVSASTDAEAALRIQSIFYLLHACLH